MVTKLHLYQEIHQQPAVLRLLLAQEKENMHRLAEEIRGRGITNVVIAARGTSDNAGRYAKYLLGAMNGLPVALAAPSLFTVYQQPPRFGNALVLGISQSGKSPDIVEVLAEAKRQGALTAVLTNNPKSAMAMQGDAIINLWAGEELSVAATKTYSSSLTAVAMLAASLRNDPDMWTVLEELPVAVEKTLEMNESIAAIAPRYRYMDRCIIIGRGYNYATAFELAQKIKELTYTMIEPYSSADFLHGPLALIEIGFPVIVVAPRGVMLPELHDFIQTVRKLGADLIGISDDADTLAQVRIPMRLPWSVPEWASPITSIIPGQLLAMHLAYTRDYNVDAPRTIRKVTETC